MFGVRITGKSIRTIPLNNKFIYKALPINQVPSKEQFESLAFGLSSFISLSCAAFASDT
jgi:hypothetical protein